MTLIHLVMAVLAVYRLSQLLPEDDGPFFVFARIRSFVATKAMNENEEWGLWANIDKGIDCPLCCGLYAALLVTGLLIWQNVITNIILMTFALSGGQAFLQRMSKK